MAPGGLRDFPPFQSGLYEDGAKLVQPIEPGRWSLAIVVPRRGDKRVEVDVKAFEVAEVRVQF